jgi:hypothetical protein
MHSLQVFCAGVLLSFLTYATLVQTSGGIAVQILASAFGISLLVALSQLIGWYRSFDGKKRAVQLTDKEMLVDMLKAAEGNITAAPAFVRRNSRSDSASRDPLPALR